MPVFNIIITIIIIIIFFYYIYVYKAKMCVCLSVSLRISCQWLISMQNQWHVWNQQVPADVLAWF